MATLTSEYHPLWSLRISGSCLSKAVVNDMKRDVPISQLIPSCSSQMSATYVYEKLLTNLRSAPIS